MLKRLTESVAIFLVLIAITWAVFYLGPKIETRFFPVVKEVSVAKLEDDKEFLKLAVTGTKVRATCKLEDIGVLVKTDQGYWRRGTVYFEDPRLPKREGSPGRTQRPSGVPSTEIFYIFPRGSAAIVNVYHTCHPFWYTTTQLFDEDFIKHPAQVR